MNKKTIHTKPSQNAERFQWENEEEATAVEVEGMSYSLLNLAVGLIVVVVTTIILIC